MKLINYKRQELSNGVACDYTVKQCLEFMKKYKINIVPVLDKSGSPIGVITSNVIISQIDNLSNLTAGDLATGDFIATYKNTDIKDILNRPSDIILEISNKGQLEGFIFKKDLFDQYCDQLKTQIQNYISMLESMATGVIAINYEHYVIEYNTFAERLFGIKRNHFLGKKLSEVIANFPELYSEKQLLQVIKRGVPQYSTVVEIENSKYLVNRNPIRYNGHITGAISTFQDINHLEEFNSSITEVKKLKEEMDAIIDCSYDGILVTDKSGIIQRINKSYERMTGYRGEQIIGKSFDQLIQEGLYSTSVFDLVRSTGSNATVLVTPAGKHIICTGSPVYTSSGDLELVVINLRDITELNSIRSKLQNARKLTERYHSEVNELRTRQFKDIVIRDSKTQQVVEMALRVAGTDSSVFINGESGVGKEVIAKLIHQNSSRSKGPFIKVNCSAIPEPLLESELFGYEKGAFTGARKQGKPGMFEIADEGTVFLDEVADMPLILQVKLLRFLQEREFIRVGGTKPKQVDIRIIAATNRNLEQMVKDGQFREDLYFRLYVIPINIPPLRERKDDIVHLLYYQLEKLNNKSAIKKDLAHDVVEILVNYQWPGNIRELQNTVERLFVTSPGTLITKDSIPTNILSQTESRLFIAEQYDCFTPLKETVAKFEREYIKKVIENEGSVVRAARVLQVNQSTIFRKLKQ